MNTELLTKMLFHLIGGLGIFLLGMHYMREGLQTVAGSGFRKLIHLMTSNRFAGVSVGAVLTTLVQSSSVTTVMVVGFVNSGLMNLFQAIGVIMGANIGTTITGWIIAIKIGKWGLPILGASAIVWIFSKKQAVRYTAMALLGIGMVFFGLELMKNGFKPIRSMPEFAAWFQVFDASTYFGILKCALVGCILTFIVQSSSATLGITISLAMAGVIPFETAAALVLGENIGTTITAFLASLGAGVVARRAAYFHILFNLVGVLWITAVFQLYIPVVLSFLGGDPNDGVLVNGVLTFPLMAVGIAYVHTGFNVANTLFFLPFTQYIARFLNKVGYKKQAPRDYYTRLDFQAKESPAANLEFGEHELGKMDGKVRELLESLGQQIEGEKFSSKASKKIFDQEEVLDHVREEIRTFLINVMSDSTTREDVTQGQKQLRMADGYEAISDDVVRILKLYLRLKEENAELSGNQRTELLDLHKRLASLYDFIHNTEHNVRGDFVDEVTKLCDNVSKEARTLRLKHWNRLSNETVIPLVGTSYMDIIGSYRRMKDHLQHLAEAVYESRST
jgi:phosphate:Na+ symporter